MFTSFALALAVSAAPDEYYISLPDIHEIRKLDTELGTLEPWAKGMQVPFYGKFGADGHLYIGDTQFNAVWKIAPDGTAQILSIGGLISAPLSVTVHPQTGELYVSCAGNTSVVIVDPMDGSQRIYSDNSHGLYSIPGGLAFGQDGTLYMTDHGNYHIWAIDQNGVPTDLVDGLANGMEVPAGIEADNAGNLFVANYFSNTVVRIRIDTGEVSLFSDDPRLDWPNDVAFAKDGSLVVACDNTTMLLNIDARGSANTIHQDASVGSWLGVAVPGAIPGCGGWMTNYGSGTAGDGGIVPRLRGHFNPCAGTQVGYTIDHARANARGTLLYGLGEAHIPAWGGELLIDITGFWGRIPFKLDRTGKYVFQFVHPDDPIYDGVDFFLQALIFDPANPYRIAMTEGLHVHFGISSGN